MPVYIALVLLVVVASIWAPATLRGPSLRAIAPVGTLLAIAALGQMLVVMTGGIDLSVPGSLTLAAVITVGVGHGADDRVGPAIVVALAAVALVGLVNGILIGGIGLNPLIVTLAVGQIASGIAFRYYTSVAIQTPVPKGLSGWTSTRLLGVPRTFWLGVAVTVVLSSCSALRRSGAGSRSSAPTRRRRGSLGSGSTSTASPPTSSRPCCTAAPAS
jgi:ribose transport system permease protein